MFTNMEPLDKEKHSKLKLKPVDGYKFASKMAFSLLGGTEVAEASKYFPIVFPEKDSENIPLLPMAIMSFTKGENYFVSPEGKWTGGYIPVHIRRYPFIFGSVSKDEKKYVVMVDMGASQLNEKEGTPLFNEKGEPEKIVTNAQAFLSKFQVDVERTQAVLSLLEEQDVLVSKQITIAKGDKKSAMKGFRVVDPEKITKLDDAVLAKWVKNGLMGMVYSHLNSLSNTKIIAAAQGVAQQ